MKDKLRLYSKLYARTFKRKGIPMRCIIPFMKLLEKKAEKHLKKHSDYYISRPPRGEKQENIIVSLTTFPARLKDVWKTIVSLKDQSYLPEKIILWVSRDEIKETEIPELLKSLEDTLFQIKFVEGNLRSHKKYYYAFQNYPDSTIITVDDDMYYHRDLLKSLVLTHKKEPNAIVANWVYKIGKIEGSIMPYTSWKNIPVRKSEKDLLPIGVNGVLYPPHCLDEIVLNKEIFMKLAHMADDIWLNAAARLKGSHVVHTGWKKRNIPTSPDSTTLTEINCGQNFNDVQIKNIQEFIKSQYGFDIYIDLEL